MGDPIPRLYSVSTLVLTSIRHSFFYSDGTTIDQMDLGIFYGKTYVCDLRQIAKPGHPLTIDDLKAGGLPNEDKLRNNRMLMYADWAASRWTGPDLYKGNMYLSEETAHWLVSTGVVALAMDFFCRRTLSLSLSPDIISRRHTTN
ncbi:MAG: hypothetical protein CM1200mP6_05710 [Anaerolineaceae bacterium]|nr:MAG: hypothetical protein CM1200mP6_05710 [Anaerolineaceae bacterium]